MSNGVAIPKTVHGVPATYINHFMIVASEDGVRIIYGTSEDGTDKGATYHGAIFMNPMVFGQLRQTTNEITAKMAAAAAQQALAQQKESELAKTLDQAVSPGGIRLS